MHMCQTRKKRVMHNLGAVLHICLCTVIGVENYVR